MTKSLPASIQDLELGPACQRLSSKRLAFVAALVFEVPSGKGAAEKAGEIAGYPAVEARRLSRDKGIVTAVRELLEQRMVLEAGAAIDTLKDAMSDPYSKERVKAAGMVLDRVLPSKQQLTLDVTAPVDRTADTLKHLQHMIDIGVGEDALVQEFGKIGLAHYRELLAKQNSDAAKVIDGEVVEVEVVEVVEATPKRKPEPAVEERQETWEDIL